MMHDAWHPFDETQCTSNVAAFVEWLRASRRHPGATPENLAEWAAENPAGYAQCVIGFLGLDPDSSPLENLTRAGLDPSCAALADMDWPTLVAIANHHIIAETRPDDQVQWPGDPANPVSCGAVLLGAKVERRSE